MEFEFGNSASARAAMPVLQTQLEQIAGKKLIGGAKGACVLVSFPPLSARKKKVVDYTAKRLAALMRSLQGL